MAQRTSPHGTLIVNGVHVAPLVDAELAAGRPNPHAPEDGPGCDETVLSCLRTILEEEWEHLRFATRDLDALDRERGRSS